MINEFCWYHAVFRKPRLLKDWLSPGWLESFDHYFGIGVWFGITSLNYFGKRSRFPVPVYRTSSPRRWIDSSPWRCFILGFESLAFLVVEKDVTGAWLQRVEMSLILSSGSSVSASPAFHTSPWVFFQNSRSPFLLKPVFSFLDLPNVIFCRRLMLCLAC